MSDHTVLPVVKTRFNETTERPRPMASWIAYVSEESGAGEVMSSRPRRWAASGPSRRTAAAEPRLARRRSVSCSTIDPIARLMSVAAAGRPVEFQAGVLLYCSSRARVPEFAGVKSVATEVSGDGKRF